MPSSTRGWTERPHRARRLRRPQGGARSAWLRGAPVGGAGGLRGAPGGTLPRRSRKNAVPHNPLVPGMHHYIVPGRGKAAQDILL